jgi:pimeloyl-ACP methyl ester carboxylesterase
MSASRRVQVPPVQLLALESFAIVEYTSLAFAAPLLMAAPAGNGHPVLVLPAFTATDTSTRPLRSVLRWRGHEVHGWGLGRNMGPHPTVVDGMRRRLDALHRRYRTTVSIVGWSLGGVYARELARDAPDLVRQVITLGSPFRLRTGDRTWSTWLYDVVAPRRDPYFAQRLSEEARPRLPVPSTAIYTQTDGVVDWRACIEDEGEHRGSVEVIGTHTGLGFNVAAIIAIADRLAQPEGEWAPWSPPHGLRYLYRCSAGRHDAPSADVMAPA